MNPKHYQAYLEYQKILAASRQSAYASFDRAVLTLSTAMLGLSMSFIKDVVATLSWPVLLYLSWLLFCAAIVLTLISFLQSQKSMDLQHKDAEDYYLRCQNDAISRPNPYSERIKRMNNWSCWTFVLGIVSTVIFVIFNLSVDRS